MSGGDPFDLMDRAAGAERETRLAEALKRREEREAAEARARQEALERCNELTARVHQRNTRRGFDHFGLTPPPGMAVSLEFCLAMGWRVEEVGGKAVLTRPGHTPVRSQSEV